MEINVNEDKRIVEIWLSNNEKNDPVINTELKKLYAQYKQNKYIAAVFMSGKDDLFEGTKELLLRNK